MDDSLEAVRQRVLRREKVLRDLATARERLKDEAIRQADLMTILRKEEKDLKEVEGPTLTGLLVSILGTMEQRVQKERQEIAVARLKVEDSMEFQAALRGEIDGLVLEAEALASSGTDAELSPSSKRPSGGIASSDRPGNLADAQARMESQLKEISEALTWARQALTALKETEEHLNQASLLGALDLWNIIPLGIGKYAEIERAREAAARARRAIDRFEREMRDLKRQLQLDLEFGPLLRFADVFFDLFIAGIMVQSSIEEAQRAVGRTTLTIESYVNTLQEKEGARRLAVQALRQRRESLS